MRAGKGEGKFSKYAQRSKLLERYCLLRFLSALQNIPSSRNVETVPSVGMDVRMNSRGDKSKPRGLRRTAFLSLIE
jgi:hypothetical protein